MVEDIPMLRRRRGCSLSLDPSFVLAVWLCCSGPDGGLGSRPLSDGEGSGRALIDSALLVCGDR
jgi:hypothetical protein